MRSISIVIILLSIQAAGLYGKSRFGPWSPEVYVGDDRKTGNAGKCSHQDYCRYRIKQHEKKVTTVYNGFQGGAFFLIRFFQVAVSPQDGPNCRFRPTCSAYGRQAVERYGALLGSFLAGERLLRCNPYYPPGNDPLIDDLFDEE